MPQAQNLVPHYDTLNRFDINPPEYRQCVWVCNLLLGKRGDLVYVANQVKELCSQVGRIYSCKLCESNRNKGTFHARVEFCSVQAAQRAVASLDRAPFLCGRTVRVHPSKPYKKKNKIGPHNAYFTCEQACLMANLIFGFNGWSHEIVDVTPLVSNSFKELSSGQCSDHINGVRVKVRVIVHAFGLFVKESDSFGECSVGMANQSAGNVPQYNHEDDIEHALYKRAADGALLEALRALSVAHIRLVDGSERMVVLKKCTNNCGN